jgi:pimeloyl-ACP methyl ester carboxylesterase
MEDAMKVLRRPDDRVANVPEFPYAPHCSTLCDEDGTEICIQIDEGPRDAESILLMHGNPTWAFLYRKNPGAPLNREAWARLASFDKPILTLFGELDPVAGTLSRRMRRLSWSSASLVCCR